MTIPSLSETLRKALAESHTVLTDPPVVSQLACLHAFRHVLHRIEQGEWHPDPDNESILFLLTQRILEAHGFSAYEISNFAQPGKECRHHQAIWSGEDYLGLGPGAVSTVAGRRWRNTRDTTQYARSAEIGTHPAHEEEEVCGPQERRAERILLGLRTSAGLPEDALTGREDCLSELVAKGWGRRWQGKFLLTPRGRLRADAVAAMLL